MKRIIYLLLALVLIGTGTSHSATKAQSIGFLLSQVRTSTTSLVGGKVWAYAAGGTTPKSIWLDKDKQSLAANPYTLDANGTAQLFADGVYRIVIKDSAGVTKFDRDGLPFQDLSAVGMANVLDYGTGTLAEAITAIGNTPKTLVYSADQTLSANAVIPATLELLPLNGAVINHGAYTISYLGSTARWPLVQIFNGTGAVTGLKISWPEYFATNTTPGTTDMATAFTKALAAADVVKLSNTSYAIGSTVSLQVGNKTVSGVDGGTQSMQHTTINHLSSSTGPVFDVGGSSNGGICIKNINIIGGNGSFAIVSARPYVRYDYIHMEPYNGGGIQFLSSAGGSSSSVVTNCQWVGPNSPTAYTAYEVNINGGDVAFRHCTAIRGAIGINIIQGQTITIDECSFNKQTRSTYITGGVAMSSATQFNTAGVKLSNTTTGAGTQASPYVYYKQSVSVRNSYFEVCDNSIYVESAQSLSIEDNWIDTGGAIGVVGTQHTYGNSAIYLKDNTVQNVTIRNNNIVSSSASDIADTAHNVYLLRFNNASNVKFENNVIFMADGTNIGTYYLTTSPSVFKLANTVVPSPSNPAGDYDPSNLMIDLDKSIGSSTFHVSSYSLTSTWVNVAAVAAKQIWKVYISDYNTAGNLQTEATVQIDGSGAAAVTYQVKTQASSAYYGEVQVAAGEIQIRSSSTTFGAMYSAQRIQ